MRGLIVISVVSLLIGCGTTQKITRNIATDNYPTNTSRFYFELIDGSATSADNLDGKLWGLFTTDASARFAAENAIDSFKRIMGRSGFCLVKSRDDSEVIMQLTLKSVRYDPIGGWISDDAWIDYIDSKNGRSIGKVHAKEQFVTPKLETVVGGLFEGSLEFWGLGHSNTTAITVNNMPECLNSN